MSPKNIKNLNYTQGARKVLLDLKGAPPLDPADPPEPDVQASPEKASGKPSKKRRRAKIQYQGGLGYDPETGTFKAHFRLGKQTYTRDTELRTLEAAEVWLKNFKASLRNYAESGHIPGLTFRQGLEHWAKEAPHDKSRRRVPSPERTQGVFDRVQRLFTDVELDTAITKLGENFLLDAANRYAATPGPHGPHQVGGLRSFIININSPFRYLLRKKLVPWIPTLPAIPAMGKLEIHYISPERLLEAIELFDHRCGYDLYSRIYIRMLGFSGLRTENARNLMKDHFNLDEGTFNTGKTKNGDSYILPIPEDTRLLLQRVPNFHLHEPLFKGTRGAETRGYHWCLQIFKSVCKDLGIKTALAWHSLRASYATFLLRSGVDVTVVKELMTHETLAMILRYAATDGADLANAQAKGMDYLQQARTQRQNRLLAQ
jgi:integrase